MSDSTYYVNEVDEDGNVLDSDDRYDSHEEAEEAAPDRSIITEVTDQPGDIR